MLSGARTTSPQPASLSITVASLTTRFPWEDFGAATAVTAGRAWFWDLTSSLRACSWLLSGSWSPWKCYRAKMRLRSTVQVVLSRIQFPLSSNHCIIDSSHAINQGLGKM